LTVLANRVEDMSSSTYQVNRKTAASGQIAIEYGDDADMTLLEDNLSRIPA
jgi:hypothetical protein